jgi:hypothetical protein
MSTSDLAASIGVETHMPASRFPDWQWPADQQTSPRYPSTTIHWQKMLGDWTEPLAEVMEEL